MSADKISDEDVELVARAARAHHLVFSQTNADGHNPCVCGGFWDSVEMEDWDEHMARVALAALAGRLLPAGGQTRTEWGRTNPVGEVYLCCLPRQVGVYGCTPHHSHRRVVTAFPDERELVGPWVNVEEGS
jgi:hypothetical protein